MLASLFLGFTTLLRFTIRIADVQNLHYRPKADEVVYKILATTYCKLHFTQSLKDKTRLDIAKDI